MGVLVSTLDSALGLARKILSVSLVLLSKAQKSVDGLLVIGMRLNLDNHLLQSPDSLFTALLGHLVLQIAVGAFTVLAGTLLLVFGDVFFNVMNTLLDASLSIDAGIAAIALFRRQLVGGIPRIARAVGVGCLSNVASNIPKLVLIERRFLVEGVTELLLHVLLVEIRSIVPLVVCGRIIDSAKSLLVWTELASRLCSGVAGNVAEKNTGIRDELAELAECWSVN